MKAVVEGAARCTLYGVAWVVRRIPAKMCGRVGRMIGWLWYRGVPIRRRVARENVGRALGLTGRQRDSVVRGMYLHLGQSFVEFLRYGRGSPHRLPVKISGRAGLSSALASGRGVILVTAHLGNWELLVRSGTLIDGPVMVVSKALKSNWAHTLWMEQRVGGADIVFPAGAARKLVTHLRSNGVVGYVLDQHSSSARAAWLPFFGRAAATSPDVVRLARTTGATVLPVFIRRTENTHQIEIGEAIKMPVTGDRRADELEGTRRCLQTIEEAIRRSPEQWLWIHRRWKSPPQG